MYDRRLQVFILICALPFAAAIARLAQIQLFQAQDYREKILAVETSKTKMLKTTRGRIIDRTGRTIAGNEVKFYLCVSYNLTRFADERFWQAELIRRSAFTPSDINDMLTRLKYQNKKASLQDLISKCMTIFGLEKLEIDSRLAQINDNLWQQRAFRAWYRNCIDSPLRNDYAKGKVKVDYTEAMTDFQKYIPLESDRLRFIAQTTDIAEAYRKWPLIELKTDQDIFSAQLAFRDPNETEVRPVEIRNYPYACTASQLIGWVGYPQERDLKLFEYDRRARYLGNELCGHSGVEYVCEPMLRGRRGLETYTWDKLQLIDRAETEPGEDVRLTVDIELQRNIETMMQQWNENPMAAVVLDVASSEILSLVSLPVYDITTIRKNYSAFINNPDGPLTNRAIDGEYPAGSVMKPVILIAGLEEGLVRPDEVISCPSRMLQPPNCWRMRDFGIGHDQQWSNIARNAIKGSCNIYFSRLAERLSSAQVQKWMLKFGYGSRALREQCIQYDDANRPAETRTFEQLTGMIASKPNPDANTLGILDPAEKRFFGIGQGSLRVTPLQVANAMAAIARGGIYRPPHLFMVSRSDDYDAQSLDISPRTIAVVRDGMHAVTSETSGTANEEFSTADFSSQGVRVFGKTGSTESPEHAWFAGFAEDNNGRCIAFSVLVERGKRGSKDAAPIAKRIVQLCIDAGRLGPNTSVDAIE